MNFCFTMLKKKIENINLYICLFISIVNNNTNKLYKTF